MLNDSPKPRLGAKQPLTLLAALLLGTVASSTAMADNYANFFGDALATGDFDGDDYPDLAVGVQGANESGLYDSGRVDIFEGNGSGLSSTAADSFIQGSGGVGESAEDSDFFGDTLAAGDFDGDGYDDLAIGSPFEDRRGKTDAGVVQTLYGTASGLSTSGDQVWDQDVSGVLGMVNPGERFGEALASGDFDGDGYDDLAIGAPEYNGSGATETGEVLILPGSSAGLTASGDQLCDQSNSSISGTAEADDHFGEALAAGEFDGDGYDDLAIGVPGESLSGLAEAGRVVVLYGSSGGLLASGSQGWHQNSSGVSGTAEADDRFGHAVTAGDFDGDGYDDLAIGAPFDSVGSIADSGYMTVLYGGSGGLSSSGSSGFSQSSSGIPGNAEEDDVFSASLAAGDFDGDGRDDLMVGAPQEGLSSFLWSGRAVEMSGTSSGLTGTGAVGWHQDTSGVLGENEDIQFFGWALATADFDQDGYDDVAIGIPNDFYDATGDGGSVSVIFGSGSGLTYVGDQILSD